MCNVHNGKNDKISAIVISNSRYNFLGGNGDICTGM